MLNPKCLSKSAAAKLRNADKDGDGKKDGKAGIARAVKRKRAKDSTRTDGAKQRMSKTKRIEDPLVQHREEWVNALKEHEEQVLF